jgi:hypothetical protein
MMEDAIEGLDEDGIEEEAEGEVDKILFEITDGNQMPCFYLVAMSLINFNVNF